MRTVFMPCTPVLVAIGLACGDSTGVDSDTLIGTWSATRLEFTSVADPSVQVDLIDQGVTFTITLSANGTYAATITFPSSPPENETGTWQGSVDVLTLTETGQSFSTQFDMALTGNTLTLSGGDTEFDFDDDGTDEAATLDVVLVRQ